MRKVNTDVPKLRKTKICVLGDHGAGKTSLVMKYLDPSCSISAIKPTIGMDSFHTRVNIDEKAPVVVHFWDFSGSEQYTEIRNEFYEDADAFIIVFDSNSKASFANMKKLVSEGKKYNANFDGSLVLGNKYDMKQTAVSYEEAEEFASSIKSKFFAIAANAPDKVKEQINLLIKTTTIHRQSQNYE